MESALKSALKYLPVALLTLSSSLVYGAEDCSLIENTQDRLACYDTKFPRADPATVAPDTNSEAMPETSIEDVPDTVAGETQVTPKTESVSITETPAEPPKSSSNSFFAKKEPEFTATVKGILNKDQRKMAFLLSNEQIWLQNTPRNLPIREGDEVTIKKGSVGGFIMRTASGTSTRVSRIH